MNLLNSFLVIFSKFISFSISIFKIKNPYRKLVCLALVLSLLILPNSSFAFNQISSLASSAIDVGTVPINYLPSLLKWLFRPSTTEREDTLEDRLAHVSSIQVSPARFVGYEGETIDFAALGVDYAGRTIQGLVFSWESSNSTKIAVDDNGRATLRQSGMCEITCHAGTISQTARVLVKPGQRPRQTDNEWRNEQMSLSDSSSSTVGALLPKLLNNLMPTARAQGGGYSATDFGFDEMWSESRNLTGNPRNRALEPMVIGSVLPEGSNANFAVPIIGTGGRGLSASLSLFYNSRVWSRHGNYVTFAPVGGFPFAGFSLGYGRIVTYGSSPNLKYVLVDAEGTQHYLGSGTPSVGSPFQTTDGTHITYNGSALYYNDGTKVDMTLMSNRIMPSQINDSNGNFIKIAYGGGASPLAIDYLTDTKGRIIDFNYDASGLLISITAPGYGGTAQNPVTRTVVQFDYESRTLSYTFSGLTVENVPSGSMSVLKHVYFPGTNTGYLFTYSDYGMIANTSLRRQMSIDGNGVISDGIDSASVSFNYPTSGSTSLTDAPAFTQRTESATGATTGTYSYSSSSNSLLKTRTFTIARPDSSNLVLTRSTDSLSIANGLLMQTEITKNSTSYSKVVTSFTTDGGGNIQPQTIISYDDSGTATKVDFDFDNYGNVTNKREYGNQISGNWQVRRRTHLTYKTDQTYLDAYLRSLTTLVEVFDALENTNDVDDVLFAKTSNTYDDYAATGGMTDRTPKPPGHDSAKYTTSYTVRGNVTGTTYWTDVVNNVTLPTRLKKYDRMGSLLQEQVSCCKQKVFSYVSTDYWANPPDVTKGDPAGLHLTGTTTYDFNTDLPKYIQTPTTGKIDFYYDAALRQTQVAYPVGYSETRSYNDGAISATLTKTGLGSNTLTYNGWQKIIQQVDSNNGQVNISYDAMGRISSRTNPFAAGGTPGTSTSYQYDALDRVIIVTLPDNNTLQGTYNGSSETFTDQVNRKVKRESDGLGRLVKVTEQDVSTGNLTQETTYTYNLLDKLTGINQGNQTRSFIYDGLGRLTYERIPEQGATIWDGGSGMWSTRYTYTDFNAVATKMDARGAVKNYSYDGMNRLTGISYNVPSGVAATPSVSYTYDTNQSSSTNGLVLSVSLNGNTVESYGYDSFKRMNSLTQTIDSNNYVTSYQFNSASQVAQITYPSTRVVNLNRDSVGRLSSLTDTSSANYVSGLGYNVAGQMTGLTLGNGVVESNGYDPNRLQLTSQTATKSGTTLLSLTYSYTASAGQNGSGSTTGNSGQLMSISGSINATSESAGYTYDNLGRLVTSNQTTNGTSAQRRFVYDKWGNRTSVYNATSGGTLLQNVNLEQSGGVPTNRLISVAQGLSVKSYTYDAAGNVTNDGVHTYQYDAENRLVSVDSGTTATYAYDHQSRRIKKTIGSSVTHCIWQGKQVIAEYDGSTSALLNESVYSGSRLIARFTGSAIRYYLNDRLSERLTLDASGNIVGRQAHLPFGEELGINGEQEKHRLTNYERDSEDNQDYAINRQYSNNIGRFLQTDPHPVRVIDPRKSGSFGDPQSLNRYNYVRNDPINAQDPTGGNLCFGNIYTWSQYSDYNLIFSVSWFISDYCVTDESSGNQASGTVRTQIPPLRQRDREIVDSALAKARSLLEEDDCNSALSDYGIPSLAALLADLQIGFVGDTPETSGGNIFDGREALYTVTYKGQEMTVRDFFRTGDPNARAITIGNVPGGVGNVGTILLGPNFFSDGGDTRRAITLLHEAVHRAGLQDTDFGEDQDSGSWHLTQLLKLKCNQFNEP